jgi:hypothetical protein
VPFSPPLLPTAGYVEANLKVDVCTTEDDKKKKEEKEKPPASGSAKASSAQRGTKRTRAAAASVADETVPDPPQRRVLGSLPLLFSHARLPVYSADHASSSMV